VSVVDLLHLDAQLVITGGLRGSSQASMETDHRGNFGAVRQLSALDHLGDHADAPELPVLAGQEEYAVLSPVSTGIVAVTPGKTIASSSGIRGRLHGE